MRTIMRTRLERRKVAAYCLNRYLRAKEAAGVKMWQNMYLLALGS
jgi:hypothetical protein